MALILVVDDEATDLEMMRAALAKAGYTVITATDGTEALKIYQQHQGEIRLLLTDVAMSPIDGCELATRIIELEKDLPVIFVSGYAGAHVLPYKSKSLSHAGFLRKPFVSEDLLAKVREFMPSRVRTASGHQSEF
jgi:CheY-like chemotaxis protein